MISSIIQSIIKPIISSVVVSSSSLTYDEMVIASSPNRYYKQDETSGTIMVDSIAAKNGNLAGSYTLGDPSLLSSGEGTSIDWGGTSNSTIPQDSDFNTGTGDFTWMLLVKTNATQDDKFIIDLRQADTTGYHITTGGSGATLSGSIRYKVSGGLELASTTAIDDGSTYHCTIKRTSGSVTLWVDGVSEATGSDTTSYTRATGNITYMINSFGAGSFNAITDELVYYKRALTDAEIVAFAAKAL